MTDSEDERLDKAFEHIPVFDREGKPISYSEFSRLRADHQYRFLARDKVGDAEVATAWLGIDQGEGDPPRIFGTVNLAAGGGFADEEEIFASTEVEALVHHAEVLGRRTAEHETDT